MSRHQDAAEALLTRLRSRGVPEADIEEFRALSAYWMGSRTSPAKVISSRANGLKAMSGRTPEMDEIARKLDEIELDIPDEIRVKERHQVLVCNPPGPALPPDPSRKVSKPVYLTPNILKERP